METNLIPFLTWDEQLDTALEEIAKGGISEGYVILSHYIHSIESGTAPDPRAAKFVLDGLKKIVIDHEAGKKVDYSLIFRMKPKKGRPRLLSKGRFNRAMQYGGEVASLMQSGKKNSEAIQLVADKYKRTSKTINEYYTLFNKIIES